MAILKSINLFLISFLSLVMAFMTVIFISPNETEAQIHIMPKASEEFLKTLKGGKNISDTKACSRLFKDEVPEEGQCRDKSNKLLTEFKNEQDCLSKNKDNQWLAKYIYSKGKERDVESKLADRHKDSEGILACALVSGNVRLWMLPYYVRYFSDFILAIAGSVSILMLIIGGYSYIVGSISTEGEGAGNGKKIIKYSLIGLIIAFSSWALVNTLIAVLTG